MKRLVTICAVAAIALSVSGLVNADVMQDGGDRLVDLQNNDGGWDWPLDDSNPANVSPKNTIAPIAMGLAKAQGQTGDAGQLTALQNAGGLLLGKTNNFSPSDGYLAAELDSVLGGTAYVDHVKTNFYNKLATGTYDRNGAGTLFNTADYINLIDTARAGGGIANLAAWDIGIGLYAANAAGADTTDWVAGVKAEINELDGAASYDVIGLAGGIMGLASVGEAFDPTAGEHAAAGSLGDLATILGGYQLSTGGFTWNSGYVIEGDGNETIQETAYALMALKEFDGITFLNQIASAGIYLTGTQLGTGGWENYLGSGENNEITGEALWGIATVPEPATMCLLGLGGLMLRRRKKA